MEKKVKQKKKKKPNKLKLVDMDSEWVGDRLVGYV